MPDFNESVVQRGACGGVHDPKVHEEFYSPIVAAVRMKR